MLAELDIRIDQLFKVSRSFHGLENLTKVMSERLQGSASDIKRFYAVLRPHLCTVYSIHLNDNYCQEHWNRQKYRDYVKSNNIGPTIFSEESFTLGPLLKSFLFFLRLYQDILAGGFLILNGDKVGPYTSMKDCLKLNKRKEKKHLSLIFEEHLPGYPEWFSEFRKLRNDAKLGFSNSIMVNGLDIGIGFLIVDNKNDSMISGGGKSLKISDMALALQYSIDCTELLLKSSIRR